MAEEGKYIYGIIGTSEARSFGPIGVGGQGDIVSTICHRDLGAIVSNMPVGRYEISRENLLAHQIVVERAIADYTVLPVKAFTIAANAEEVRDFLRRRYQELTGLLKDMDGKIELGVIAHWKQIDRIFQEIVEENEAIRQLKQKAAHGPPGQSLQERVAVGEMVASALAAKKQREGEKVIRPLKRLAVDVRLNSARGDDMIVNAVFLVDRAWEKEFDSTLDELDHSYGQRIRFRYIGPSAPYNFIDLRV